MNKYLTPIGLFAWHMLVLVGGNFLCRNFAGADCFGASKILSACIFAGLVGGVIYCLRGIYYHFCVRENWNDVWIVWHGIRPVVSALCGGVSYFFLKSGLFLLSDTDGVDSSPYVYYVLAFLAGYNVDNFLRWSEGIHESLAGVKKSRASGE